MIRRYCFVLIVVLLISSTSKGQLPETTSFHDGFEYPDPLTERGYVINNTQDPDMVALTDRRAATTGERGLLVESNITSGWVGITRPMNVKYRDNMYFSFHIMVQSAIHPVIRLEFNDGQRWMALDYGTEQVGWEDVSVFDMGVAVLSDALLVINRRIQNDLATALQHIDSPYSIFAPTHLTAIKIFHEQNGYTSFYMDEMELNFFDSDNDTGRSDMTADTVPDNVRLPVSAYILYGSLLMLGLIQQKIRGKNG